MAYKKRIPTIKWLFDELKNSGVFDSIPEDKMLLTCKLFNEAFQISIEEIMGAYSEGDTMGTVMYMVGHHEDIDDMDSEEYYDRYYKKIKEEDFKPRKRKRKCLT